MKIDVGHYSATNVDVEAEIIASSQESWADVLDTAYAAELDAAELDDADAADAADEANTQSTTKRNYN